MWLFFITVISLFFSFYNLGAYSISIHSDEIIHVRVVQDMYQSGKWWLPMHGSHPYFNKPPLKMWLSLIPLSFLGETNFSYRFIDGFACFGTAIATFLIARRRLSNLSASIAVILLLGSPILMFGRHGFRHATQDGFLVFVSVLALGLYWLQVNSKVKKSSTAVFIGFLIGCGVLTKSFAGFVPLLVILFSEGILRVQRRNFTPIGKVLAIVVISILIPSLYIVPHIIWTPKFFQIFFNREIYNRAIHGFHNQHEPYYYLVRLFESGGYLPPVLLIMSTLWGVWKMVFKQDFRCMYLLIWSFLPIVFYSLISSRLAWYIAIAIPGMCILIAAMFADLLLIVKNKGSGLFRQITAVCVIILTIFLALESAWAASKKVIVVSQPRLEFDLVAEFIRGRTKNGKKTILFSNQLKMKAVIGKGNFNVDGFYLRSIGSTFVKIKELRKLKKLLLRNKCAFLVTDKSLYPKIIPIKRGKILKIIKPWKTRKEEAYVIDFNKYQGKSQSHGR